MINRFRSVSLSAALVSASILSVACSFEHTTTNLTAPSPAATPPPVVATPAPAQPLVGTYVSPPLPPGATPTMCGSIKYQISSQTASSVSGVISGECGNGLVISGNGLGQLNGNAVTLTATGNGTMPSMPNCAFSLGATGTFDNNNTTLRLSYSTSTCLGPASGLSVLTRQ